MKYSKILVTGGAGFIGSHIVSRLISEGCEVTVLDNFVSGKEGNLNEIKSNRNLKIIRGDIRDQDSVKKAVENVEAIFHEAAMISVITSIQEPILNNDVNVNGTLNLLKAAADSGVKRFIFASSAAVYGEESAPMKTEDMALSPSNPYGVSKLAAEKYVTTFFKVYGLETVALRYFNVYGPRQSFDINSSYGGVVTIFLNRLIHNLPPTVFGDGEQTRDFVSVFDIAEANMLALNSSKAVGECINIASGARTTVNQVAEVFKNLLNKKQIENQYKDARIGEAKHGYAGTDKAKNILGFEPKFSFDKGAISLVEWYKTQIDSSAYSIN